MQITITQIKSLGDIPEELLELFLRIANGLIQKVDFTKEKIMTLFAAMLDNPKKYAFLN